MRIFCISRPPDPPPVPSACRRLFNNRLNGSLPPEWGLIGAFPRLQILALQNNSFEGAVPGAWWRPGGMRSLQEL